MSKPPRATAPKPCCVCNAPGGKHCTKCKSRHYCSKACQLVDWNEGGHKAQCKQLASAFQDRLLDEIMPAKKVKEEPPIVEDVLLADSSKAAARLSAVPTEKTAIKASALNGETPGWRGTCAICLDLLPVHADQQTFYACCCKRICTACSAKWQQHDTRCPLCRSPPPSSDAEVVRRMQKHVNKGNAEAQLVLGDSYSKGDLGLKQNFERGSQLYERAAAQGNAEAQTEFGHCYEVGKGVKIDYKTAALWYRRAAEQGFPPPQCHLGHMFYEGKGVAQSYEEAVKWYRLAAAQGHPRALLNLGTCHINGQGVPRDSREALRLYKRAAAKGDADAAAQLERLEAHLAATRSGPPA